MKKLSPKNDKNVKDLKTAQKELDAEMHKNDAIKECTQSLSAF